MSVISLLGVALAGFVGGAIFMVTVLFVGLKFNLKGIRTAYAGVRQDARFYKAWALLGGGLGAAWMPAIPMLDAWGIKDPWFGLIMIGIAAVLFIPMFRFLKRHRNSSTPRT